MTLLKNKGYIYKITNIITGQFYIGQRSAYIGIPEDDLGIHYFTSSKYVKPLFMNNTSEWQKEILYRDIQCAETLNDMEAYAIHKVINDKLCENRYDPSIHNGFGIVRRCRTQMTEFKPTIIYPDSHYHVTCIFPDDVELREESIHSLYESLKDFEYEGLSDERTFARQVEDGELISCTNRRGGQEELVVMVDNTVRR